MIPESKLKSTKKEKNSSVYVIGFQEIDRSKLLTVGGKGANQIGRAHV